MSDKNQRAQEVAIYNLLAKITAEKYGPFALPVRGKSLPWWDKLEKEVTQLFAEKGDLEKVVNSAIAYKDHSRQTISSLPKEKQEKPMEGRMALREEFHRMVDEYENVWRKAQNV